MKKWAFYKDGDKWCRIGVYAALSNEKKEPGFWRRKTYYSTHFPPDSRLKMHIRESSKGTFSFAYNRGQDSEIERLGGGESLIHYLYKVAISQLGSTTLKISNLKKDIDVQFISAETEKRVHIDDRYYDLDVFVKFKSKSNYELKWSGELGIEVHNTNPVIGQKLKDLKALRIPVIEVAVNKKLAYKTSEEYSTSESESSYIEFLKERLSEYLWSKILSDPKSLPYLEKENSHLINLTAQLKDKLNVLEEVNNKAKNELSQSKLTIEQKNISLSEKEESILLLESELEKFKGMGFIRFLWYKLTSK